MTLIDQDGNHLVDHAASPTQQQSFSSMRAKLNTAISTETATPPKIKPRFWLTLKTTHQKQQQPRADDNEKLCNFMTQTSHPPVCLLDPRRESDMLGLIDRPACCLSLLYAVQPLIITRYPPPALKYGPVEPISHALSSHLHALPVKTSLPPSPVPNHPQPASALKSTLTRTVLKPSYCFSCHPSYVVKKRTRAPHQMARLAYPLVILSNSIISSFVLPLPK